MTKSVGPPYNDFTLCRVCWLDGGEAIFFILDPRLQLCRVCWLQRGEAILLLFWSPVSSSVGCVVWVAEGLSNFIFILVTCLHLCRLCLLQGNEAIFLFWSPFFNFVRCVGWSWRSYARIYLPALQGMFVCCCRWSKCLFWDFVTRSVRYVVAGEASVYYKILLSDL